MNSKTGIYHFLLTICVLLCAAGSYAQPAIKATLDTRQVAIGDQARLFIEATPAKNERLVWAVYPDTFNNLEIVEKGKIDTVQQNGLVTYKQRLLITGWDSGMFTIPAFTFTSVPAGGGQPYTIVSDSFALMVQTIPVDTTKAFKPIADILEVKMTWRDYIWWVLGAILALGLIAFVVYYFTKNKKVQPPAPKPVQHIETVNEKALRLLLELEQKQLWQNEQVKQYYVELTDILRDYIQERFKTPAMELTTDELLLTMRKHKDMMRHQDDLAMVLQTADMAKFAKAQPTPQEHTDAFEHTRSFVEGTKPVITQTPTHP